MKKLLRKLLNALAFVGIVAGSIGIVILLLKILKINMPFGGN